MKSLLIAGALALGMVFALGDQPNARTSDEPGVQARMERGVERVDGYLQNGLSKDTHDELASQAQNSANLFKGLGASVANVTD